MAVIYLYVCIYIGVGFDDRQCPLHHFSPAHQIFAQAIAAAIAYRHLFRMPSTNLRRSANRGRRYLVYFDCSDRRYKRQSV